MNDVLLSRGLLLLKRRGWVAESWVDKMHNCDDFWSRFQGFLFKYSSNGYVGVILIDHRPLTFIVEHPPWLLVLCFRRPCDVTAHMHTYVPAESGFAHRTSSEPIRSTNVQQRAVHQTPPSRRKKLHRCQTRMVLAPSLVSPLHGGGQSITAQRSEFVDSTTVLATVAVIVRRPLIKSHPRWAGEFRSSPPDGCTRERVHPRDDSAQTGACRARVRWEHTTRSRFDPSP